MPLGYLVCGAMELWVATTVALCTASAPFGCCVLFHGPGEVCPPAWIWTVFNPMIF